MEALVVIAGVVFGHRHNVDRTIGTTCAIDHWCGSNPDLGTDLRASTWVGGGLARLEQRHVPYRCSGIGVEGVHTVVLRGYNEEVTRAVSGYGYARSVQGLCIDLPVRCQREKPSESRGVDIAQRQSCLAQILTSASDVVMVGQDILRLCQRNGCQPQK